MSTQQTEHINIEALEQNVRRLLVPLEPSRAFRDRLHKVLVAAASGKPRDVQLRPPSRARSWLLSVSGVALAVFLGQYFLRLLRRR